MSTQSPEINKLADALAKAQGEIVGATKDAKNLFFKSNYADLASVWEACRMQLSKNGLSVIQTTEEASELGITVVTTLAHSSGQWIQGRLPIRPVKNDPQGIGSAITYARRYALAAIVGVAQIDDDGEAAMSRPKAHPEQPAPDDGIQGPPGEYRIPGHLNPRLAGKAPRMCDPADLRQIIIETEAKYKGKIMPAGAVQFIKNCEPLVAAWENGKGA